MWLADLATQDRDLVPQHQQLGSDRGLAARKDRQPPEQAHHDQVEESKTHDRRSCLILIFPYLQVNHAREVLERYTMRGLKRLHSTQVISAGHAFVQNLRRGHYELGLDADPRHQLSAAFAELTLAV